MLRYFVRLFSGVWVGLRGRMLSYHTLRDFCGYSITGASLGAGTPVYFGLIVILFTRGFRL